MASHYYTGDNNHSLPQVINTKKLDTCVIAVKTLISLFFLLYLFVLFLIIFLVFRVGGNMVQHCTSGSK